MPAGFLKSYHKLIGSFSADIIVIGEGEQTLLEVVNRLKEGKSIKNGPGIFLPKDWDHNISLPQPIEDLNSIPFPTFSEFNLSEYNPESDYKPIPLILSRGCIGRCCYCIDCIMWPKFRCRLAEHVFKEIEYHIKINKAKAFEFNDLTCNGNLKQLSGICDLIIESGLKFDWVSYAIIRKDMGPELFSKLKQSGCHTLIYGVESGSDKTLGRMKKTYTSEDAQQVIRLTHDSGICTNINIIVGFPGETEEDLEETVRFLQRNKEYIDKPAS